MPSTKELRRRIKSIKNTAQITKAMQMVSAAKMKKAQNQAIAGRPYWSTLLQTLALVSDQINPEIHPLLSGNSSEKIGVVVMSTDKGLCGSLNANINRAVSNGEFAEGVKKEDISYYSIGKKGRDFVIRTSRNLEADFVNPEHVSLIEAIKIRRIILQDFLAGKIGKVFMIYPRFVSTLRQEVKAVSLLPISQETLQEILKLAQESDMQEINLRSEFVFEPSADQVLDYALVHLIDTRIYQGLLETRASEHSARMIAMQNATDNAKDLVEDLGLLYNQIRQNAITTELLEITSAGAALE